MACRALKSLKPVVCGSKTSEPQCPSGSLSLAEAECPAFPGSGACMYTWHHMAIMAHGSAQLLNCREMGCEAVPLIVAAAVIILLRLLQIGWTRDPGLPALCPGLVCPLRTSGLVADVATSAADNSGELNAHSSFSRPCLRSEHHSLWQAGPRGCYRRGKLREEEARRSPIQVFVRGWEGFRGPSITESREAASPLEPGVHLEPFLSLPVQRAPAPCSAAEYKPKPTLLMQKALQVGEIRRDGETPQCQFPQASQPCTWRVTRFAHAGWKKQL